MATSNKTIYIIDGDMDAPPPPPMPDSEESKRWFQEAWAIELIKFAGDAGQGLTEEAIGFLSEQELKLLCERIQEGIANSAEMQQQQATAIDYTRVAERWKAIAERSGSPNAAAVSQYANHVLSEHMVALELLEEAADDPTKAIPAAGRLGKGIGYIFLAADVAGAFQNGANDPRGVPGELAGILAGTVATTFLITAAGGLAAIIGAPVGVAIAAIGTILVAAYAATQLGEFVWEAVFEDGFWDLMETLGWKENMQNFMQWLGNTIDPFVPGDPEGGDTKPVHVAGGEVATGNEKENVVLGNNETNSIIFMKGRTTAYGKGGNDDYTLYSSAVGGQIINDSEGENTLSFGIVDVASVTYRRTGENRYASPDDYFTLSYYNPDNGGRSALVVSSKHYPDATVTLLDWKNGDFGLTLPGMPVPPEPLVPNNNGTSNGDYINPGMTGPGGQGIVARGFGGRDMIWGGDSRTDDKLYGDGEGDIINGRGGKDEIDGGDGDDFISGFGDGSTVYGGAGDDIIDAGANYGFEYWSGGVIGLTLADVWNDVGQYFTWTRGDTYWTSEDGDLRASYAFNLTGGFDYSGASSSPGLTYRFFKFEDSSGFRLKYYDGSHPNGWPAGSAAFTFDNNPYMPTQGVSLYGGSGDDNINGASGNDSIDGGDDDDMIAGMAGNDSIDGGDGNDRISGGLGADVINGGSGDDTAGGGLGRDVLYGGEGNDTLWGDNSLAEDSLVGEGDYIDGGAGDDGLVGEGGDDILDGGIGNDHLTGGVGDDVLLGGEGEDSLDGGAGRDVLLGGAGKDTMVGGEGDDSLSGGAGDDAMAGGLGKDALDGGAGNDILAGNEGDDRLDGNEGDDQLWGGDGADVLRGGVGDDQLVGDSGDDVLEGGQGKDNLWGDAGRDTLYGDDGKDTLQGGAGDDQLMGGAGADELYGEADNDLLKGGGDNDTMLGGAGDDTLDGEDGDDYLAGDDFQGGAQGNDHLSGGAGDDVLVGGGGNDTLLGGEGQDVLYGDIPDQEGGGNDVLDGGAGDDYLHGGEGADQLLGGEGNDTLLGAEGDDVLRGGAGNDFIDGGAGANRFEYAAGDGHDTILAKPVAGADNVYALDVSQVRADFLRGNGFDLVISIDGYAGSLTLTNFFMGTGEDRFEFADGTSLNRSDVLALFGGAGNGTVIGGDEGGLVLGGSGNETLYGGMGDDAISGGGGNDLLIGFTGNDQLDGGTGNDVYEFGLGFGWDNVLNLGAADGGSDIIRFKDGMTRAEAQITVTGDDVSIVFHTSGYVSAVNLQGFLAITNGTHVIEFADGTFLRASDLRGGGNGLPGLPVAGATEGDDQLYGGGGNDLIGGLAGSDLLYGGAGNDHLQGGAGSDRLFGGDDNDTLDGGEGNDVLDGGAGDDRLIGGGGIDVFRYGTGYGNDTIVADGGTDLRQVQLFDIAGPLEVRFAMQGGSLLLTLEETGETLTIEGYNGANGPTARIVFGDGTELTQDMLWSSGNVIEGTGEDDVLYGYGGDDELYGQSGYDTLFGGDGDDFLSGGWGEDRLYGGNGNDLMYGDIHYRYWWVDGGDDDFMDGGDGVDSMWGMEGNDVMFGGAGDDWVNGEEGDDTINGGAGDDWLVGNGGSDTYVFGRGGGKDVLGEFAWLGEPGPQEGDIDTLRFDASVRVEDVVIHRRNDQPSIIRFIIEGTGDSITVNDFYSFGTTNPLDTIEKVEFADGTAWNFEEILQQAMRGSYRDDNLLGHYAKDDFIDAGAGNDRVMALDHNDMLLGGAGNDRINGGDGDDILIGGSGADVLSGDAGNDTYRFGLGSDQDFIVNGSSVSTDHDIVELGEGITTANIRLARSGDALVVDIDGHEDRLMVLGHFQADEPGRQGGAMDALHFADGTIWTADDIVAHLGSPLDPMLVNIDASLYYFPDLGGYVVTTQGGVGEVHRENSGATWYDIDQGGGRLFTGTHDDTYAIGKGYGRLEILDAGGTDRVLFHDGVAPEDVALYKLGEDMVVQVAGLSVLVVTSFFAVDGAAAVESMTFADGTVWDSAWLHAHTVLPDKVLTGTPGNDTLLGGIGNDTLYGLRGADTLDGAEGNDLLDGGAGADVMRGGKGSDTYIVDDLGDTATDDGYADGWVQDVNVVKASVSFALSDNLQELHLTGSADIDGTGNDADNVILGNAGNNVLRGAPEDASQWSSDWLDGGAGNDTLFGSVGNDTLIGGGGADILAGMGGHDLYFVDSVDDIVIEGEDHGGESRMAARSAGLDEPGSELPVFEVPAPGQYLDREGDTVASTIDYTLGDYVEALILMGEATAGTGNALDNWLTGNALANTLLGLDGYDRLEGGAGNDLLEGGEGDDNLNGGLGNDMVVGGDGYDIYQFTRGDGDDVFVNADSYGEDSLYFNEVSFDQIDFNRSDNDLVATLADQGGSITFSDWYTDSANRLDWLYDSNYQQLSADDVDALVGDAGQGQGELNALVAAMAQGGATGLNLQGQTHPTYNDRLHIYYAVI